MNIYTYQDLKGAAGDRGTFLRQALDAHRASSLYQTAVIADEYDHQRNTTICNFVKTILTGSGSRIIDTISANNQIASNFFHRLSTQRCTYSLGNGVTLEREVKALLGEGFDTVLYNAGYQALIHGVSFLFWNADRVHVFPVTQFAPLWDEETGLLRAGIRFWQISQSRPLHAVLYEPEGYTQLAAEPGEGVLRQVQERQPYLRRIVRSAAFGDTAAGEESYGGALPVIPLWGSRLHQSALVGLRQSIDSYDLIRSGFANDLSDCAQIYWIVKNAGGMDERDLAEFRERLLLRHIANVDAAEGAEVAPYTQEVPYQARGEYLSRIRAGIYEDFGGLDVSSIAASARTATEITAAYQPLDENADDFEYQIIACLQELLALLGVTGDRAVPRFKRNRIANQPEQTQMVLSAASYLDRAMILEKLPWLTPEEIAAMEKRRCDSAGAGDKSREEIRCENHLD